MNAIKEIPAFPGLDMLSTAVIIIDEKGYVEYINPSAEHLFDISKRSATGLLLKKFFENPSAILIGLDQIRHRDVSFTQHEIPLQLANQKKLELSFTISPIEGYAGNYSLIEFVSPSQQTKVAREQRINSETAHSRELIRNLAHEIKNPLGALRGAAQLLERELDSEDHHEYTSVIIKEADRLRDLVDRLLTPHKLPQMEHYNVHEVTERVRSVVRAEFSSGLRIERDYDLSLPDLIGDKDQINQAVLNITRNAAQALMGRGLIRLKTRVARNITVANKFHKLGVVLDVFDNGPGIAENIRDSIFFPLISSKTDGSGLGLSIAQTFISRHNGVIDVESEPGHTCFSITLPIDLSLSAGK